MISAVQVGLMVALCVTCSAQQAPAAAANGPAPTWFMQAFEQCGGTGGVCNAEASAGIHTCADKQYPGTICPMTFTCQRQSEAFWQCLPQQLQAAAAAANKTARANATGGSGANAGAASSSVYQPAQIEGAGFRRFKVDVWPNCKPWEMAIASRCVPAPHRNGRNGSAAAGSAGGLQVSGMHAVLPLIGVALVVAAVL